MKYILINDTLTSLKVGDDQTYQEVRLDCGNEIFMEDLIVKLLDKMLKGE